MVNPLYNYLFLLSFSRPLVFKVHDGTCVEQVFIWFNNLARFPSSHVIASTRELRLTSDLMNTGYWAWLLFHMTKRFKAFVQAIELHARETRHFLTDRLPHTTAGGVVWIATVTHFSHASEITTTNRRNDWFDDVIVRLISSSLRFFVSTSPFTLQIHIAFFLLLKLQFIDYESLLERICLVVNLRIRTDSGVRRRHEMFDSRRVGKLNHLDIDPLWLLLRCRSFHSHAVHISRRNLRCVRKVEATGQDFYPAGAGQSWDHTAFCTALVNARNLIGQNYWRILSKRPHIGWRGQFLLPINTWVVFLHIIHRLGRNAAHDLFVVIDEVNRFLHHIQCVHRC